MYDRYTSTIKDTAASIPINTIPTAFSNVLIYLNSYI